MTLSASAGSPSPPMRLQSGATTLRCRVLIAGVLNLFTRRMHGAPMPSMAVTRSELLLCITCQLHVCRLQRTVKKRCLTLLLAYTCQLFHRSTATDGWTSNSTYGWTSNGWVHIKCKLWFDIK
eukprot:jgi/Botrbrau1/21746/Bobra.43_1s0140.1